MIGDIPKISVLVITYNQEDVITRTIESLLVQRDYIYEICVSDDCSKDKTWEILNAYSIKYPGLFVLNRNEPNVGIFKNVEQTWKMPTGDLVYRVAGDDEAAPGWLKTVCEYIKKHRLDYKNSQICIYGNYKALYPNGDSFIESNHPVNLFDDLVDLSYRGFISNRSCCYSRGILNKYVEVSQGRSHIAEIAQEIQLQLFSCNNYYIPYVGNIYHAGVGVSVNLSKDQLRERRDIWPYTNKFLQSQNYTLSTPTKYYGLYMISREEYLATKKPKYYLLKVYYYLRSTQLKYIKYQFPIKRAIFALIRRMPHKGTINWK